jgi:hypothetical protein
LAVVARDRIGGLDWVLQDVSVGRPVERGGAGRVLLRSDVTEPGFVDTRPLAYANTAFTPDAFEARQRRLLVDRTVALRNAP